MRFSVFSVLALSTGVIADATETWAKLHTSLNVLEYNLNHDRGRFDNYWVQAQEQNADGNTLTGVQKDVATELWKRIWITNGWQIAALQDFRAYLFYNESDPDTYYGPDKREVKSIDFHLPKGMIETQPAFNDGNALRGIKDIPGCEPCASTW
ncbi:hypothetical protein F5Y04DRAFT_27141 [Hypomontagnella monticulosa]|nr:hypothetical protein F5Y04DRAFT_27141 [Hypomontagnella monticulosa]